MVFRRGNLIVLAALALAGCGGSGNRENELVLNVRKEVGSLTPGEKQAFVQTLQEMKRVPSVYEPGVSAYDYFVKLHIEAFSEEGMRDHVHGGWQFLPWHRELLRRFESELRRVSNGRVQALPYWDWSRPGSVSTVFNDAFLGGDGDANDRGLVKSGPFRLGSWPIRFTDITEGEFGGSSGVNEREGIERAIGADPAAPTLPDEDDVEAAFTRALYDIAPYDSSVDASRSFRRYMEGGNNGELGMHNRVHVFIGGDMNSAGSPNDPAFFLHHANIDRLWAMWQDRNPTVQVDAVLLEHGLYRFGGLTMRDVLDLRNMGIRYDSQSPAP